MILGIGNNGDHVYSLSVLEDTTTFIVADKASLKACDLELADKQKYPETGFTDRKNKNGVFQCCFSWTFSSGYNPPFPLVLLRSNAVVFRPTRRVLPVAIASIIIIIIIKT